MGFGVNKNKQKKINNLGARFLNFKAHNGRTRNNQHEGLNAQKRKHLAHYNTNVEQMLPLKSFKHKYIIYFVFICHEVSHTSIYLFVQRW